VAKVRATDSISALTKLSVIGSLDLPEAVLAGLSDCAATGVLQVKAKHSKLNPMGSAGQTGPKRRGEK
jgi:hypothetical protein